MKRLTRHEVGPIRSIFALVPALALALAAGGCNPDAGTPPSEAEISEAQSLSAASAEGGKRARSCLDILSIVPSPNCSSSRPEALLDLLQGLAASASCAVVTTSVIDSETDSISLNFFGGCAVNGHSVEGPAVFTFGGASGNFVLTGDMSSLVVDGRVLGATAGYEACDAPDRAWVNVSGSADSGFDYTLDMEGVREDGGSFGGAAGGTIIFDGNATITGAGGTDECDYRDVAWDAGDSLPSGGRFVFETHTDHHMEVIFDEASPDTGEAELEVDGHASVVMEIAGSVD